MKFRGPLIGLTLFMVVALTLTWLVYVSLRRDVAGQDGLVCRDVHRRLRASRRRRRPDGRGARRPGRKDRTRREIGESLVRGAAGTAPVRQHRRLGDLPEHRRTALSADCLWARKATAAAAPPGSVIPLERTEPSFDVTALLNGYEPLFSLLNPQDADNLTKGVIAVAAGRSRPRLPHWSARHPRSPRHSPDRDQALGDVITNLNKVVGNLAAQNDNLDGVISQTREVVSTLDQRRPELQSSVGSLARVTGRLSTSARDVYPALREFIDRKPGVTRHLLDVEPQVAFFGDNIPLLLKGLARVGNQGAYGNAYVCDVNFMGFFPGLNDVVPIIINAATPGNKAWHTPRCRNMANG